MHKFGDMIESVRKRTRSNDVSADGSIDGTNSDGNESIANSPMIASRKAHSPASSGDFAVSGSANIASALPRWIDSVQGSHQDFADQQNSRKQELKALWNDMMAENDYKHRMMERNEEIQTQLNDALEQNQALLTQIQQLEEDRRKAIKEAEFLRGRERAAEEERRNLERELEEAQSSSRKMYEDLKELGFEHVGLKSAMSFFEQTRTFMDENLWLANRDLSLKEHERRGLAKTITEIHEQFINVNQIGGSLRNSYIKQLDLHHALLRKLQLENDEVYQRIKETCSRAIEAGKYFNANYADSATQLLETLKKLKAAEIRQEDPHTTISQLRNENDNLRRDIKSLQTLIADGQRESKENRKDKSALSAKLEQVLEEAERLKHDKALIKQETALLVEQNTKLGVELGQSHSQVNELHKQLQNVNAQLQNTSSELDQTKLQLNLGNLELEKTNERLNLAHVELEKSTAKIQKLEVEMNDAQKTAEMTNRCEIQTPVVPVRQSRLPSHHTKLLTPNLERSFTTRELDCTDVELPRLAEFQLHLDLHKNRHTTNLTLISESFTRIADMREPILDDATTEEALRLVSNLVSVTVELRAALDGTLNKLSVIEDEAEKLACQQSLLELSLQSLQSLADSSEETVERLITLGILCDRNSGASTTSPAFLVGAEADSRSSHPYNGRQLKENRSSQHSRALTDERVYQSTSRNPAQVRSGSGAAPRRRSAPVEDSIKSRESTSIKAVLEKRCSVCTASPPRSNGSTSPNPSDGGSPSPSLSSPRHSASIARRPLDSPSARARASPNLPNKRK